MRTVVKFSAVKFVPDRKTMILQLLTGKIVFFSTFVKHVSSFMVFDSEELLSHHMPSHNTNL